MNHLPLVSCIMPTYNRRPFVPGAIAYFARQEYPNRELIVADDGTDAVGDLVPDDPRVRYLRLERKARPPVLRWLWDNYRREKEQDRPGAEIYSLLGVIIALAVFDLRVAVAAIMMTVFGDLAACLVGMKFGRLRPAVFGGKSIEGSAVALVVNLAVGFVFLRTAVEGSVWWWKAVQEFSLPGAPGEPLWAVIVVMALVAAVVELMISAISDNLTIPVISGFAGEIALLLTQSG